jgi:hypothetical protein
MAGILILSGSVALGCVIILAGPLTGRWMIQRRQASNAAFVAAHQEMRERIAQERLITDTDGLGFPALGEDLDPERFFAENPLFSLVLPRELDPHLPIADSVFDDLVARKLLTGVGVEVTAEWDSWDLAFQTELNTLQEKELVAA